MDQLGVVVGRNVRRYRLERALTQHELSQMWRRAGLPWARSKLAALESGRRPRVDAADLMVMSSAMGLTWAHLVDGWHPLVGDQPECVDVATWDLSKRLGLPYDDVLAACAQLFGRSLGEERDERVRSLVATGGHAGAHRGHVTRELAADVRRALS